MLRPPALKAVLCAILAFFVSSMSLRGSAEQRGFTVTDSITMTTFSDPSSLVPNSQASLSPDGRHFYWVTTHGIIDSNQVESTLWLIDAEAVRRFLFDRSGKTQAPAPQAIARISAVPGIQASVPNAPLITDLRWSRDSHEIFFLGQDSRAERQLYEVDMEHRKAKALTSEGRSVRQFDFVGNKIAYTANKSGDAEPSVPWDRAAGVNADAGTVTGMGLEDILSFPEEGHGMGSARFLPDLWVSDGREFQRVGGPGSHDPVADVEHSIDVLSLSPDGREVVRLLPVATIPSSWSMYDPMPGFESWRISPQDTSLISPSYWYRLREYQLIDTRTGEVRTLINAPNADSLAEEDLTTAVWSHDGARVLVGNVALPLDGVDLPEQTRRRHTCALASVDIPSLKVQCVVFTRDASAVMPADNSKPLRLKDARFGTDNDEVLLRFAWHGRWGQTERYRYEGGQWKLAEMQAGDPYTGEPIGGLGQVGKSDNKIALVIKQDLNTPPTLWAIDAGSGVERMLWNPNPQLNDIKLGKAALYHWKDKSGYTWTGVLITPPDYQEGKSYPLVIQTHGYLDFAFISDGLYPTAMAARPLSSAGIMVLQTTGRADHFSTGKEPYDEVAGWQAAIVKLSADGLVDQNRVGVVGFSRTCWHVEQALISDPRLFKAATIADGMDTSYLTYRLFGEGRPSLAKEYDKIIGVQPSGDGLSTWLERAPSFHLDKVVTPLQIQAIGPSSVLAEWEIYASLRQQHKPVDLMYIPGGQHILQKPLDRLASQQGVVDWFRFWLQSYDDGAIEKRAQYDRWRMMRAGMADIR